MKEKVILGLYWLAGLANLITHLTGAEEAEPYTKPLLMPLLIYYLYTEARETVTLPVLLTCGALIFSWLGDIALLFQDSRHSFVLGLGAFLVAQLFYITALHKSSLKAPKPKIRKIWPLLLYGIVLSGFVLPKTGQLLIPVTIYATTLLAMVGTAIIRQKTTSNESYRLAAYGAALFVISDSILAINRFSYPLPYGSLLVMATYIPAQFLIVKGILRHPGYLATPRSRK